MFTFSSMQWKRERERERWVVEELLRTSCWDHWYQTIWCPPNLSWLGQGPVKQYCPKMQAFKTWQCALESFHNVQCNVASRHKKVLRRQKMVCGTLWNIARASPCTVCRFHHADIPTQDSSQQLIQVCDHRCHQPNTGSGQFYLKTSTDWESRALVALATDERRLVCHLSGRFTLCYFLPINARHYISSWGREVTSSLRHHVETHTHTHTELILSHKREKVSIEPFLASHPRTWLTMKVSYPLSSGSGHLLVDQVRCQLELNAAG